jgi:hypothetical protein
LLVILCIALLFYGIIPVFGAFLVRRNWRMFRNRFNNLRLSSLLDYSQYQDEENCGKKFRFLGGLESITDDQTLWVRNADITIPVDLQHAHIYLLPNTEEDAVNSSASRNAVPERIRLERLSSLHEGAKVYIGGVLDIKNDRLTFLSTKENPLLIIFYDGSRRNLSIRIIRAGRQSNEYWNALTPYSLAFGAFLELLFAFSFIARPAYQLTLIVAILAMFGPLFPLVPPGIIFTTLYSRMWRKARMFRSYRDVFRLPLKYLPPGKSQGTLPNGEIYGFLIYDNLPAWVDTNDISYLPAELKTKNIHHLYVFGTFTGNDAIPLQTPNDPLASFSVFPEEPKKLAKVYAKKAHVREIISCIMFALGIGLNCLFIVLTLYIILMR